MLKMLNYIILHNCVVKKNVFKFAYTKSKKRCFPPIGKNLIPTYFGANIDGPEAASDQKEGNDSLEQDESHHRKRREHGEEAANPGDVK